MFIYHGIEGSSNNESSWLPTRQHQYEVVAGNRRLSAIKLLGLRKISCHVVKLSDREAYEVALVENIQHKTLNPIEEAVAFNQYVESFGWGGISELARRIGKSQEFVTKRIQLLRLPERVKEEIIRQRMTPSVALEMLPLEKEAMEEFADFIIKNPLTKDEVRRIIRVSKEEHNGNDCIDLMIFVCSSSSEQGHLDCKLMHS
jgi:ParB family chromosome partitioning protein